MNRYQEDSEPAGVVELKLVSYDFNPAPCAIRLVWTREIPDLKRFTADLAEITTVPVAFNWEDQKSC